MFTCPRCKQYRNDFDRTPQGTCIKCGGRSAIVSEKSKSVFAKKHPCASCKKFIGPSEGQMFKGDGSVFCWDCLTSGKWLEVLRKKGIKTVETPHEKKGARFGKG